MRILVIAGKVDSRILVYPLARALSLAGLTAIISDDGAYRRLYLGVEDQGTVSGVDISVGHKSGDELKNSLNNSGVPYDNIILITTGYVPADATGVIICKGIDKSMSAVVTKEDDTNTKQLDDENEAENQPINDDPIIPEGVKSNTVYISFEAAPKKGASAISLKDTAIKYIYSCEERKELQIIVDKSFNKTLVQIASEPLGIPQAELFKLLNRKEYISGK